jgi:hypothetical protein
MRDSPFLLGTAAVAIVCCAGISLLAAAGGTGVLGLAGIALPAAALLGSAAGSPGISCATDKE